MGTKIGVSVVLLTASLLIFVSPESIGEFKRMPDLRGQSFGLENFLMQPFNLASQADESSRESAPHRPPSKRRTLHQPAQDSYSVEFQVPNDEFDMRRLVPTLPGASMIFDQTDTLTRETQHDMKPVHEEIVDSPPPPLRTQQLNDGQIRQIKRQNSGFHDEKPQSPKRKMPSFEEEVLALLPKRRLPPPETRRPLEKPAEFMVSLTEHVDPFPSPLEENRPERHRKRVMKRRRKKPAPPTTETTQEDKFSIDQDPIKEIEDNLFSSMPTSYQETVKDATGAESIVIEHGPPRRKPPRREPAAEEDKHSQYLYQDKLLNEATQNVLHNKEIIQSSLHDPTTENPSESTQRLKTLLKQQNGQLSLSELLQTQNLSLADFLQGNPGALSALGGTKTKSKEPTEIPLEQSTEKERTRTDQRPHIPKISSKSRPFSKPFNGTKTLRRSTTSTTTTTTTTSTTEEPAMGLPKKLQIIEVTSEKPSYNFIPKRPRLRVGHKPEHKFNFSRERTEEPVTEKLSTTTDRYTEEINTENAYVEDSQENELQINRTTTGSPIQKSKNELDIFTEQRATPKRYGEYKPKNKIERRKPFGESTTEGTTTTEAKETTIISTTEEIKNNKESRNRVRIPFMSVNNPEISVILPSKRPNTTTEKPRPSPVIKDRINVFKRLSSEEKVTNENREMEPPAVILTTKPLSTTTPTAPFRTTTTEQQITGDESSDEIVELLKTGNNAQRLQRILSARNMTVDELVEKRANSSRQPNVTRLFEKNIDQQLVGNYKVSEQNDNHYPSTEQPRAPHTTKRILPVFDILSPNYKTDHSNKIRVKSEVVKSPETNSFDELFVDESVVRPIRLPVDQDDNREAKSYSTSQREANKPSRPSPSRPVQGVSVSPGVEGKAKQPVPLWDMSEKGAFSNHPYSFPTYDLNNNLAASRPTTESPKPIEEDVILLETIRKEDSHSRLKSSIDDILKEKVEVREANKEDVALLPPAVKSAIIASGVVMGIALIVFVAIFAACGWKQRQFRLRARSSILNDSIDGSASARKVIRRTGTLSPVSFKRSALYNKTMDFDTESSVSGSSNTSSYLWNTLKHTFQSRNSTLKNREEKEEKINERENRSRRNTLCREEERPRRNSFSREEARDLSHQTPRRNTTSRDDLRRDSLMSRDTLSRDQTRESMISRDTLSRELARTESRRSNGFREDRRINSLMRDSERCSFKTIDPDRQIIQTSVNFKRGGFNGSSSRHFDTCDHFN